MITAEENVLCLVQLYTIREYILTSGCCLAQLSVKTPLYFLSHSALSQKFFKKTVIIILYLLLAGLYLLFIAFK